MPGEPADQTPDLFAMIERLSAIWAARREEGWTTSSDYPLALGPFVYAYASQTVELAEATAVLVRAGRAHAAVALVRAAMEFALTAAWLSVEPLTDDLLWHGARRRRATLSDIHELELLDVENELDAETRDLVARSGQPARQAAVFEDRCRRLVGGRQMYATYRVLSGYCHPEVFAADRWIVEAPEGSEMPVRLLAEPRKLEDETVTGTAGSMMLQALLAAESLQAESSYLDELRGIARELGVAESIALVDRSG